MPLSELEPMPALPFEVLPVAISFPVPASYAQIFKA